METKKLNYTLQSFPFIFHFNDIGPTVKTGNNNIAFSIRSFLYYRIGIHTLYRLSQFLSRNRISINDCRMELTQKYCMLRILTDRLKKLNQRSNELYFTIHFS